MCYQKTNIRLYSHDVFYRQMKLILLMLLLSTLSATVRSQSNITFQSWQSYIATWDSLEQSDDTYFEWLSVDRWYTEFGRLQRSYTPEQDQVLQLEFIEAYLLFFLSEYEATILLYQKLLTNRSRLSENQLKWCLVNLEESFRRTGNLKEAIPIRKERIELGLDQDFFEIYEEAGLYREALVEFTEHNDLPRGPLRALGYYSRLGRLHKQDGQLDSAIYYYEKAYEKGLATVNKENYLDKSVYFHRLRKYYTYQMKGEIGLILVKQGRHQEAIPLLRNDIATCKEVDEVAQTVPKRLGLAESYLALGQLVRAKLYLDTIQSITSRMDWVDHQIKYLALSGKYHFEVGQYDSAAIFLQKSYHIRDSLQTIQNKNKLIATTAFLDNERQGKLIAQQRSELERAQLLQVKQQLQVFLLIGAILVVMVVALFLYSDAKRKKKAQAIAERDKEIISRQADELKELDKAKTRFFSNISHEFRTPLTLIEGPVQSIRAGKVLSKTAVNENLAMIERNAQTLRNLIDEVLDFNKMDAGEVAIVYRPVILLDWLSELIENYQFLCKQKGIKLKAQTQMDSSIRVELDTMKIEHVLNNLVSNAVKYARSVIVLDVRYVGNTLNVVVSDDGAGISKEDLPNVFERFYQTKHGEQIPHSSGIGLAYVKEIIALMQGGVKVWSEVDKGTVFTLSIPAERSAGKSPITIASLDSEFTPAPYAHPNNRLLIVEDNAEMQQYIQQVVGEEFETKVCSNGAEALEVLDGFKPDLIISDVMMPVMNGIELLKQVKAKEFSSPISFIILTARRSHELKLEALNMGLDDYLTKPFSPLELEVRVKNLLKNQFERNQWIRTQPEEDQKEEDPFVQELRNKVIENLSNSQFGVVGLAEIFHMSDRQLTRLTRKTTGLTPAAFIREVRLSKSLEILLEKRCETVVEVAETVGLGRASHFSKVFFQRYGRKPSQYLKNAHSEAEKHKNV